MQDELIRLQTDGDVKHKEHGAVEEVWESGHENGGRAHEVAD